MRPHQAEMVLGLGGTLSRRPGVQCSSALDTPLGESDALKIPQLSHDPRYLGERGSDRIWSDPERVKSLVSWEWITAEHSGTVAASPK